MHSTLGMLYCPGYVYCACSISTVGAEIVVLHGRHPFYAHQTMLYIIYGEESLDLIFQVSRDPGH